MRNPGSQEGLPGFFRFRVKAAGHNGIALAAYKL